MNTQVTPIPLSFTRLPTTEIVVLFTISVTGPEVLELVGGSERLSGYSGPGGDVESCGTMTGGSDPLGHGRGDEVMIEIKIDQEDGDGNHSQDQEIAQPSS